MEENISNKKESELYKKIYNIVAQLKLEKTNCDSYDKPSISYELETLFFKLWELKEKKSLYVCKPYQLIGGKLETLIQCMQITFDGDLISKSDRNDYFKKGLIAKSYGFNIITKKGIKYLDELGIIHC